jgi:hypothetical protein
MSRIDARTLAELNERRRNLSPEPTPGEPTSAFPGATSPVTHDGAAAVVGGLPRRRPPVPQEPAAHRPSPACPSGASAGGMGGAPSLQGRGAPPSIDREGLR